MPVSQNVSFSRPLSLYLLILLSVGFLKILSRRESKLLSGRICKPKKNVYLTRIICACAFVGGGAVRLSAILGGTGPLWPGGSYAYALNRVSLLVQELIVCWVLTLKCFFFKL